MGRNEAAAALAAKWNKTLGEGAVVIASDMIIPRRFTSGALGLDVSIGGGFAANQWTEIYGRENHGKTAITLKTVAANQALDPDFHTLWIASEHYDLDQATALGVDTDRVDVLSTRDMAVAYDVVLDYLQERGTDLVVIDSYPALTAPQEDEKSMDEYTQAEGAKMTNKFFRKVGKAGLRNPLDTGDRPWLGLFINQPRKTIPKGWQPPGAPDETTPGGMGKNFAFYTRLDVARAEWIGTDAKKKNKVGQVIRTKAVKNKGGPPQRVASIDFYFTDAPELGFKRGEYDTAKDVLTMAVLFDVVTGGTWKKFGDRQWQGLPKMLADVRAEPDLLAEIDAAVREAAANPQDKRTWDEEDVEAAQAEPEKSSGIKRRRRGSE